MNYIDTRDLIGRETEIKSEIKDVEIELDGVEAEVNPAAAQADSAKAARLTELRNELEVIQNLREEIGSEFDYGETMIPVSEFIDYAQELADDIGAIDSNAGWPNSHIDWKAAAEELKMDYIEVEYQGKSYYVRSV